MIKLWDAEAGTHLTDFTGHTGTVYSVKVFPAEDKIVSGAEDRTVRIWDTAGRQLLQLDGHAHWVMSLAVSKTGEKVVSGSSDTTIREWVVATGQCLQTLTGHSEMVRGVAFIEKDLALVPMQLEARKEESGLTITCTSFGGNMLDEVCKVDAGMTWASLTLLLAERIPPAPGTAWKIVVMPKGECILGESHAARTLSDLFGLPVGSNVCDHVEGDVGVAGRPPSAKELTQKRYRLNTIDGKPQVVSGLAEPDPRVAELFGKAWDEQGGGKAKVCAALGLDEGEWVDGLDKEKFVRKFGS